MKKKELSQYKSHIESLYECKLTVWEEPTKTGVLITIYLEYNVNDHQSLSDDLEQKSIHIASKFKDQYKKLNTKSTSVIVVHELIDKTIGNEFERTRVLQTENYEFDLDILNK